MALDSHGGKSQLGEYNPKQVAVIGLGYVGLSLAAGFGQHFRTVGFDVNPERVHELQEATDRNGEFSSEALKAQLLTFSNREADLEESDFFIVAVPTPLNVSKAPDLSYLESACTTIGRILARQGASNSSRPPVVVFESTVSPGCTEEFCGPILENISGLQVGQDFKLGFSPERVNPGDAQHSLTNITKIVSGQDNETLDCMIQAYAPVVPVGLYPAPDIRTAEAAKLVENVHRDVSIALMNELAMAFNAMGLDTQEVLKAAQTKWNFPKLEPGLVGGDCIPVSPIYLATKANEAGFVPELLLSSRRINDGMGNFVAQQTVERLRLAGRPAQGSQILVLGLTFKEDVRDHRNTRVADLIRSLESLGAEVSVYDPLIQRAQVGHLGFKFAEDPFSAPQMYDAVVLAVAHREFRRVEASRYSALCGRGNAPGVLIDVKGVLPRQEVEKQGTLYWRL